MKNITKTIITAVLLLLTVGLFAQDSTDDKAIVKDANGISTGLTKAEYDQFVAEYTEKLFEMGVITKNKTRLDNLRLQTGLKTKLNLNAIDEIAKLEGVTNSLATALLLEFGVISTTTTFWGVVKSISEDSSFFEVEVKEIIKGEDYLRAQYGFVPQVVKIANLLGEDCFDYLEKRAIGSKIICIQRNDIIRSKDTQELYFPNTIGMLIDRYGRVMGGKLMEDYLKRLRKVVEINDDKNFYRRKYTLKGGK